MRATATISARFSAAHRLVVAERDDDWNQRIYGPCCRPSGHGHDYELEVSVAGEVDPSSGWLVDADQLRRIVDEAVVRPCHLHHLNHDVEFLRGVVPTAENLVLRFAEQLRTRLGALELVAVSLHETGKNRASWVAAA